LFAGKPVPEITSPLPAFPRAVKPGPLAASVRNTQDEQEKEQPVRPDTILDPGILNLTYIYLNQIYLRK
jgi:interleukin-1 receptor-associated kinase 2